MATQAQIDALEAALASGELTVEYNGNRTTYRSVAELKQAIRYFKDELATSSASRINQTFAQFTRD